MWQAIHWLHLIAMAFFVGGQLFLLTAALPVLRADPDPERTALRAVARRFAYGTLVAIGVLIATGAAMAEHFQLWDNDDLQLKLGLVGLTAILVIWHMRRPTMHALEGLVFVLSLVIVWLGLSIGHGY
jgi:uncharacterized membrane protein